MSIVSKAILFAAEHHQHQFRKGSRVPYMCHLMNVARILADENCSDAIIAAGILHDVVEDTPVTLEELRVGFGEEVAELVRGATEPDKLFVVPGEPRKDWQESKQNTLFFLERDASLDQLKVAAADKLDNLRNMQRDQKRIGEAVWSRFSAPQHLQAWYFGELVRILRHRGKDDAVLSTLGRKLEKLHRKVF